MRVALATCADLPDDFRDDELLEAALREAGVESSFAVWDDPSVAWERFDRVVIRSTWDYTRKLEQFLAWTESIDGRLRNPPALVRWNSDKRYLADLRAAGVPTVETRFVAPGERLGELPGEVVVKPAVSAGGRDTGRFGPAAHDEARALVARIQASGRTAMVQPFIASVDARGETAIVYLDGEAAHALRKRAVLRPDEIAPVRRDGVGAAEAMYDPDLVVAAEATPAELALGRRVVDHLAARFATPLYVRVDMLTASSGEPIVLEVEAVEPCLYFAAAPASAKRLANAIIAGA